MREKIEELAKKVGFPLTKIYVVDASKRSAHSNAYFYGFGSNKRIVLFDTLLDDHKGPKGEEEILGILRHELGHWHYHHTFFNILWAMTSLCLMFGLFSLVINNHLILYQFGFKYESNFVSFMIFSRLYDSFAWITSLIQTLISRKFEF